MNGGAFGAVLQSHRDELNARFHAASAQRRIDSGDFSAHLRDVLAPVVERVATLDEGAIERVTLALYDLSLELFAAELLGPRARVPYVDAVWRELVPRVPRLLRVDPRRTVGAMTNAILNVVQYGGDASGWLKSLSQVIENVNDIDELLDAGTIAAWLSGLAHLRRNALRALSRLRPQVTAQLLSVAELSLTSIAERLATDRWFDPRRPDAAASPATRRIGAFRGFGGRFLQPPLVMTIHDHIVVSAGEQRWELHADVFGVTLTPLRTAGAVPPPRSVATQPLLPGVSSPTSSAVVDGAVAMTSRYSFAVFVGGLAP